MFKMSKKLKKLREELRIKEKEYFRAQLDHNDLFREENIPHVIEKYKGKYFRYDDFNSKEQHSIYLYCNDVFSLNHGIFHVIIIPRYLRELPSSITENFTLFQMKSFDLCQIEITKEEYVEVLKPFKESIDNFF